MKRKAPLNWMAITCMLWLLPMGVRAEKGDVALVKEAFRTIIFGLPGEKLLTTAEIVEKCQRTPIFQPLFIVKDLVVEADPWNPDLVRYSCTIPGATGVVLTMLNHTKYQLMDKYCPRVPMSGTITMAYDTKGNRRILADRPNNPFYLYMNILLLNEQDCRVPVVFKKTKEYTKEEYNSVLIALLETVGGFYGNTLGQDNYVNTVISRDFAAVSANFKKLVFSGISLNEPGSETKLEIKKENAKKRQKNLILRIWNTQWGPYILILVALALIAFLIILISFLVFLISAAKEAFGRALKWNAGRVLRRRYHRAITHALVRGKLRKKGYYSRKRARKIARKMFLEAKALNDFMKPCVFLHFNPDSSLETQLELSSHITNALYSDDRKNKSKLWLEHLESVGGWAIAALGRCAALNITPDKIDKNRGDHQVAMEKFDKDFREYIEVGQSLEKLKNPNAGSFNNDSFENAKAKVIAQIKITESKLSELRSKVNQGSLSYIIKAGVNPFEFIAMIACDKRHQYSRYVVQGAMMGLIPFLLKHAGHPDVKPVLEKVLEARAEMIGSDSQMTFFEVRVPAGCTSREYATILAEVLMCANPSMKYADMGKFIKLAQSEIPGIMQLLENHPLRLIDPVNQGAEGFFKFDPYKMGNWVVYTPPLGVGPVNRRFNEIVDMTVPNATGLNLRLFTNPYSICPVLFHEYCHYCADHNEASVFLRTLMFSQQFYTEHRGKADPKHDYAFIHMQSLLGMPPEPERVDRLNQFILDLYGPQLSTEESGMKTRETITSINMMLSAANFKENWCPDIRFPLLRPEEDMANFEALVEILTRFHQLPRVLTKEAFDSILSSWMPASLQ